MDEYTKALAHHNTLFQRGELNFQDFMPSDLPSSTKAYFMMWVDSNGWSAKLHQPVEDNLYLFEIDHPMVRYLVHLPSDEWGEHMWGDKNFENLDNNLALSLLVPNKQFGGPETIKDIFDSMDEYELE